MGKCIHLKPEVVPHKYISSPPRQKLPSQLSDAARKKKGEYLDKTSTFHCHSSKKIKLNPEAVTCVKIQQYQSVPLSPSSNKTVTHSVSPSGIFKVSVISESNIKHKHVAVQVKPTFKDVSSQTQIKTLNEKASIDLLENKVSVGTMTI
ncbi:hypothetical protein NQ314_004523 [Rhamnusium bicolor]|uniref:Uncharacterized protein n=1 Tax=Rhamnusium bicolor TaxID=1586634 RepID=A0AAV8ZL47_9CUCU|nr:hypothetical protein NQ314_004523 [Rhamnusium bicolor]